MSVFYSKFLWLSLADLRTVIVAFLLPLNEVCDSLQQVAQYNNHSL